MKTCNIIGSHHVKYCILWIFCYFVLVLVTIFYSFDQLEIVLRLTKLHQSQILSLLLLKTNCFISLFYIFLGLSYMTLWQCYTYIKKHYKTIILIILMMYKWEYTPQGIWWTRPRLDVTVGISLIDNDTFGWRLMSVWTRGVRILTFWSSGRPPIRNLCDVRNILYIRDRICRI